MTRTFRRGAAVVVSVLLVVPSLLAQEEKGGRSAEPGEPAKAENTADMQPMSPAAISNDYRIGVNDVLDVHVWKEPELSRVVPVRPDGKISLPLAGELQAQDRTPVELREDITERLTDFVTHPEVTVIVQQINSRRYFVLGEVERPGVFPLTVPTTAVQALATAGGFREFADRGNITIVRRAEDNRTIRIKFSYKDWLKKEQEESHLQLQNGDVIVVP